jgi:putative transposase
MNDTTSIVCLRQPDDIDDPLTQILRAGARRLLAEAIEREAEVFLEHRTETRIQRLLSGAKL